MTRLIVILLLIGLCGLTKANNVRITRSAEVAGAVGPNQDTILLSFSVSWDNSWKMGPNWDAVYLFLKYRQAGENQPWYHLPILPSGHNVGGQLSYFLSKSEERRNNGIMIYRRNPGVGSMTDMRIRLKVDITAGDMTPYYAPVYDDFKSGRIEIAVGAIEMVYVPAGPFYLGDMSSESSFKKIGNYPAVEGGFCMKSEKDTVLALLDDPRLVKVWDKYPKGFGGFYCMKYELSQEQYSFFLNKLTYDQQKARMGFDPTDMRIAAYSYVFGENPVSAVPMYRNGIILERDPDNLQKTPMVFGHNLTADGVANNENDGNNIACNYVTYADMLAYADWVGLRPWSEMEYEKACRLRDPATPPADFDFAWGSMELREPISVVKAGLPDEMANDNSNANSATGGKTVGGPLRVGSFARPGNDSQIAAGASFWGIFDLTGNLSEIVCNAEAGRQFNGEVAGDGNLLSTPLCWKDTTYVFSDTLRRHPGCSWASCGGLTSRRYYVGRNVYMFYFTVNITLTFPYMDRLGHPLTVPVYYQDSVDLSKHPIDSFVWVSKPVPVRIPSAAWPSGPAAYGVKGGNFATLSEREMTVSNRAKISGFATKRDAENTFRVAVSAPAPVEIRGGRIVLDGDRLLDTALFCTASAYVIKEAENVAGEEAEHAYTWEVDSGEGWTELAGENGIELTLTDQLQQAEGSKTYKFRRHVITDQGQGYSNEVTLVVPSGPVFTIDGAIDPCGEAKVLKISADRQMDYVAWYRKATGAQLKLQVNTAGETYIPQRSDFDNGLGNFAITCRAEVDGCLFEKEGNVTVYAPISCPVNFSDNEGNTYSSVLMPDCSCWMTVDLKKKTTLGGNPVSMDAGKSDGTQLYNWTDIGDEWPDLAPGKGASKICPEGWVMPTDAYVSNLINIMAKNPGATIPSEFTAQSPTGFKNDFYNKKYNGYFWALLYQTENEHDNYFDAAAFVAIEGGKFVIYKGSHPSFKPWETDPDTPAGYPLTGDENYFPVRCVQSKKKP